MSQPVEAHGSLTSGKMLVALALATMAVSLYLPGGFHPLDVEVQIVLGAGAVVLFSFAALRLVTSILEGADGITRWRLGPWYLLWGSCVFGAATLTWLGPQAWPASRVALPSVAQASLIISVSIVLWTCGYLAGPPRLIRTVAGHGLAWLLRGTTPCVVTGGRVWVLYIVGNLARVLEAVLTARFGYVGDPSTVVTHATPYTHLLYIISTLTIFSIAAAAYRVFSAPARSGQWTLWTMVGIEAGIGSLAGMKEMFILTILAVLVPYGATRGRIPLRLLLVGGLAFLCVIVPFNSAYRDTVREGTSGLTPDAAVAAAPEVLWTVINAGEPGIALVDSSVRLFYRVRMIDSLAIIMQLTPATIPYRDPVALVTAPVVGLVPRAIWPEKPIFSTGYGFSQEYQGQPSTKFTSAAVTPVGDLYRHGGLWIVAAGVLLLGIGCRLFDMLFRPEKDPRGIFFVLVFLPLIAKSEVDMYGLMMTLPTGILTAVLGIRLFCARGKTI